MRSEKFRLLVLDPGDTVALVWLDMLGRNFELVLASGDKESWGFDGDPAPDAALIRIDEATFRPLMIQVRRLLDTHPEMPLVAVLAGDLSARERRKILAEPIAAHVEDGADYQELEVILGRILQRNGDSQIIPSLSDHRQEIPQLLRHYLLYWGHRHGKYGLELDSGLELFLSQYPWPGGLRELSRVTELAILRAKGRKLGLADFGFGSIEAEMLPLNYKQAKKIVEIDFKRRFFDRILIMADGMVTRAAGICGLPRPSLSTMLKDTGIQAADYRMARRRKAASR